MRTRATSLARAANILGSRVPGTCVLPTVEIDVSATKYGAGGSADATPRPGSPVAGAPANATAPVSPAAGASGGRVSTRAHARSADARAARAAPEGHVAVPSPSGRAVHRSGVTLVVPHSQPEPAGRILARPRVATDSAPQDDAYDYLLGLGEGLAASAAAPRPCAEPAEGHGSDPLFTAFEEYLAQKPSPSHGAPLPKLSAPQYEEGEGIDSYNLMLDQLVSEAWQLDHHFNAYLSLGEMHAPRAMSLLDPLCGSASHTVEVSTVGEQASEVKHGQAARPLAVAGTSGSDAAADPSDEEDSSEGSGERGGRVMRKAVAGHAVLKARKPIKDKKKKKKIQNFCRNCGAMSTPQWRCGPEGPRTLCNACGVRWRKGLPLKPKEEQPAPPAWDEGDEWTDSDE